MKEGWKYLNVSVFYNLKVINIKNKYIHILQFSLDDDKVLKKNAEIKLKTNKRNWKKQQSSSKVI